MHALKVRSLEHVGVDEDVVPTQGSEIPSDVADSAHVGRELVHIPDASNTLLAIFRNPKVLNEELVGLGSYSGFLISTPRTQRPLDFRNFTRWWPMKPPAPVTRTVP